VSIEENKKQNEGQAFRSLRDSKSHSPVSLESELNKIDWLRLYATPSIGIMTFKHLLAHFKTPSEAINNVHDFSKKLGRNKPIEVPSVEWAQRYMERCHKAGVFLVAAFEKEYPRRLLEIDYPAILHVKCGKEKLQQNFLNLDSFAVIGARNASIQGVSFATKITTDLCVAYPHDLTIVSGLARGIDSAAHKAALTTGTIAVVGCGVDVVYPPENKDLYDKIAENGAIVSEIMLGREPRPQSFSYRNRIISGMSLGVLIVEAAMKSGSLTTARYAAEQGRDVFAVPGHPYDVRAHGTNYLIRNGAQLVENAQQIVEHINTRERYVYSQSQLDDAYDQVQENLQVINDEEEYVKTFRQQLLESLSHAPISINEIAKAALCADGSANSLSQQIDVRYIQSALAELELSGLIEIDGNVVRRID